MLVDSKGGGGALKLKLTAILMAQPQHTDRQESPVSDAYKLMRHLPIYDYHWFICEVPLSVLILIVS